MPALDRVVYSGRRSAGLEAENKREAGEEWYEIEVVALQHLFLQVLILVGLILYSR